MGYPQLMPTVCDVDSEQLQPDYVLIPLQSTCRIAADINAGLEYLSDLSDASSMIPSTWSPNRGNFRCSNRAMPSRRRFFQTQL